MKPSFVCRLHDSQNGILQEVWKLVRMWIGRFLEPNLCVRKLAMRWIGIISDRPWVHAGQRHDRPVSQQLHGKTYPYIYKCVVSSLTPYRFCNRFTWSSNGLNFIIWSRFWPSCNALGKSSTWLHHCRPSYSLPHFIRFDSRTSCQIDTCYQTPWPENWKFLQRLLALWGQASRMLWTQLWPWISWSSRLPGLTLW